MDSTGWTQGGASYRATRIVQWDSWDAKGMRLEARRRKAPWRRQDHPRDSDGRFAETAGQPHGPASVSGAAPSPNAAGATDKLGREIRTGDQVFTSGAAKPATVVRVAPNGRVQIQSAMTGKKLTADADRLTVVTRADGKPLGGDGLPVPTRATKLKIGDRVSESPKRGYTVIGPVAPYGDSLVKFQGRDLDGVEEERVLLSDAFEMVYPPGMEMPGEAIRREENAGRPSTLKVGQKFSFGMPGMDQPVYTVESAGKPREVTEKYLDKRGNEHSKTFSVVDLKLRTADGDLVSGAFEDDNRARVNHSPKPVNGPPFVPAKVVNVGDVVVDPEDRGNGQLTVTAVTFEPRMSTGDWGWGSATHDRLLTLRDEKGNVRKIYNRSDWQGVQRAGQSKPPPPPTPPKPEPKAKAAPKAKPAPKPATPKPVSGQPTVKPILYTEDKQDIIDMGFEDDPGQSDLVKEGVAAIRAKQALTAPQLAALADAVRVHNEGPDVLPGKRRSNVRVAHWLDAAAAEIQGRQAPELPGRAGVEKVKPGDLNRGDTVALVNREGVPEVVTVRGVKVNSWGVAIVDLTHLDGTEETRPVLGKSAAYLLNDLPEPVPTPPVTTGPRREHIHPIDLRPGDVIERDGRSYTTTKVVQNSSQVWDVTLELNGPADDDHAKTLKTGYLSFDGYPALHRTQRGPGSQGQSWDNVTPEENPTVVSDTEVRVGDRIQIETYYGPMRGTVRSLEKVYSPKQKRDVWSAKFIDDDANEQNGVTLSGRGDALVRLVAADDNAQARLQQMDVAAKNRALTARITDQINREQSDAQAYALKALRRGFGDSQARARDLRMLADSKEVPSTGSPSRGIAEKLLPDATFKQQDHLAEQIQFTLDDVTRQEYRKIADTLEANIALPGETNDDAVKRVLNQLEMNPPKASYADAGRALAAWAPFIHEKIGLDVSLDTEKDLPEVPDGANLAQRVALYRDFIGGPGNFGKQKVTRQVPRAMSLADLEAGIPPDIETVTEYVKEPPAKDGGPGPLTMRHLQAVRLAGHELNQEVNGLIQDDEIEFQREQRKGAAEHDKVGEQLMEAMDRELKAYTSIRDKMAKEKGYRDWDSLLIALSKARETGRSGSAEVAKLELLRDRVSSEAERRTPKAETAQLQKESNKLFQQMAKKGQARSELRRRAVQKLLPKMRDEPMGGTVGFKVAQPEPIDKQVRVDNTNRVLRVSAEDKVLLEDAMKYAADSYPASWIAALPTGWKVKKATRGYNSGAYKIIALSPKSEPGNPGAGAYGSVAVHELGHSMEAAVSGLRAAEAAFLWSRTSFGDVGDRTRDTLTGINGSKTEIGWKDDFRQHYTGRHYAGSGNYEIFTTGYQDLMGGDEHYLDDDFRDWTLGVVALL